MSCSKFLFQYQDSSLKVFFSYTRYHEEAWGHWNYMTCSVWLGSSWRTSREQSQTSGHWTIDQKHIEFRLGQFLVGMNRKAVIHMEFLLTTFTFTNTSCQSWSERKVLEKCVKRESYSWVHIQKLTQKWGAHGWKRQNSFSSTLECTAV